MAVVVAAAAVGITDNSNANTSSIVTMAIVTMTNVLRVSPRVEIWPQHLFRGMLDSCSHLPWAVKSTEIVLLARTFKRPSEPQCWLKNSKFSGEDLNPKLHTL